MSKKKHYSSEQKIIILREFLENKLPISQVSEKYNVHVNDIYNWKKKLFESAADIFTSKSGKQTSVSDKKIDKLEGKLKLREEAITYLLTENIELKKNINGED